MSVDVVCTRTIVWLADGQSSHSVELVDGVAVRPGSTRETDMEIRQIGGCCAVLHYEKTRPGPWQSIVHMLSLIFP